MNKLRVSLFVCLGLVFVLAGASKAQAQAGGGVNDAELNGDYAFTFNGFTGNSSGSVVLSYLGRFTADGAGNLINGELDSNSAAGGDVVTAQPFTGTYSIGTDHRGVMTLNVGGTLLHLAFAMTANGSAQFIEFDATGGSGIVGSGTMEKSNPADFSTARVAGDYAFGLAGFDAGSAHVALAGRVTANGAGNFTNATGDINDNGTVGSTIFSAPTYAVSDTTHGRGTMAMPFTFQGSPFTLNFVFYIVNSGRILIMETDAVAGSTPLLNGVLVQQQTPAGGFTSASLNGGTVLSLTGRAVCVANGPSAPDAIVGLITSNGAGGFTLTYDESCGTLPLNSQAGLSGTAAVAANGRVVMTIGSLTEIAYLVSTNQMFFLGTDAFAFFGPGDAQAVGAFTNSSVSGNYAGYSTKPATFGVSIFSGEFTADGTSPAGHLTGTRDLGDATGPVSGQAFAATYAISSAPANGRGTMTISSGGSAIAYVVSPSKFVVLPVGDPNPSVWQFEQVPSSTTVVTLSSLTLNPASVTGGTQSSTGTVTLSGPAPSGGAQVALASSNTGVAQVPAGVTVAAGATTATFTVSTSAVTASTAVTISASYASGTKTASLTVNPVPPPPVTLSSLTLSPTSVTGGTQSSTGTVTLSGPAPTGGARVALTSSNTSAAQVSGSVTVAAGATSATFTVSTSAVTASTAVTISASYAGATKTASLTVNPVPPPPLPTVSSLTLNPTVIVGLLGSSTGTVTLSGPAPSGGAQVALSSDNSAASVPSSVFIPAGATSATFTVNTSLVLVATSANITASYNNSSRSATLSILL